MPFLLADNNIESLLFEELCVMSFNLGTVGEELLFPPPKPPLPLCEYFPCFSNVASRLLPPAASNLDTLVTDNFGLPSIISFSLCS